ncbi:MAG: site-2 protease family protein [Clostridia bacterium]|nr:site-2 protease family protein [Clostridia bacterium]
MISNILYILLAIFMLGIIVTAHEFGHYIVGRMCGIGVVEFAIGMGPKLFSWERKGIKYSLRAIPIGGFCSFVGEDEQNDNPAAMNNQPVWKRFLTVFAGAFMNFVLAFVVCAIMLDCFFLAETYPIVDQVAPGTPAAEAGLQEDDRILSINGVELTEDTEGVNLLLETMRGTDLTKPVSLSILRDGSTTVYPIQAEEIVNEATGETSWQLGIVFKSRTFNFFESIKKAGSYMIETSSLMLDSIKNLIFKGEGLEDTAGAVGIIALVSQRARDGLYMVLWLMFIISLNLGIMNLLPLPALDGGRLIFLIVEAIRGKPVPPEKEGIVHGIGLALLFVLMIVLVFKDVIQLFNGGFNF